MNDAPQLIWPKELYCLHPDVKTFGMMITYPERKKYVLGDLLPRWRQIAELPDEWKDGRLVLVKWKNGDIELMRGSRLCAQDHMLPAEFLDFGGKSMPD